MDNTFKELMEQSKKLNQKIEKEALRKYKKGTRIFFSRGKMNFYQEAEIIAVRICRSIVDIKILNLSTGKEYWIDYYYIHPDFK